MRVGGSGCGLARAQVTARLRPRLDSVDLGRRIGIRWAGTEGRGHRGFLTGVEADDAAAPRRGVPVLPRKRRGCLQARRLSASSLVSSSSSPEARRGRKLAEERRRRRSSWRRKVDEVAAVIRVRVRGGDAAPTSRTCFKGHRRRGGVVGPRGGAGHGRLGGAEVSSRHARAPPGSERGREAGWAGCGLLLTAVGLGPTRVSCCCFFLC